MATATAKKPTTTKAPAKPAAPAPAKIVTPAKAAPKEKKAGPAPAPLPTTLVEALTTGTVKLTKVRANGTKRSLPYLDVALARAAARGPDVATGQW